MSPHSKNISKRVSYRVTIPVALLGRRYKGVSDTLPVDLAQVVVRVDVGRRGVDGLQEVSLRLDWGTHQGAQVVVSARIARPQSATDHFLNFLHIQYVQISGSH